MASRSFHVRRLPAPSVVRPSCKICHLGLTPSNALFISAMPYQLQHVRVIVSNFLAGDWRGGRGGSAVSYERKHKARKSIPTYLANATGTFLQYTSTSVYARSQALHVRH